VKPEKGGVAMKFEAAYFRTLYFAIRFAKKRSVYAQFPRRRRAFPKRTIVHSGLHFSQALIDQAES